MSRPWPAAPAGFVLRDLGRSALYARGSLASDVLSRGLVEVALWRGAAGPAGAASGRGRTTVIEGAGGRRWRLKTLERGGMLRALWHGRYLSAARPVGVLAATVEAASRGVPTAAAVALLVERDAGGLARGYFAVEELDGFEDLAERVRRSAVSRADVGAVMATIRAMHDRGVIHRDLNLGNVMLRGQDVAVIDFDRARFVLGPVPFAIRQEGIRRLERSCAKITGEPGVLGAGSEDLWYDLYAGSDTALAARLRRGRFLGRLALAAHRAGWRYRS